MATHASVQSSSGAADSVAASRMEISGIVQGVGFRPFVYRLAKSRGLKGRVSNTSAGVLIHVEGDPEDISRFAAALKTQSPPLARLTAVSSHSVPPEHCKDFSICSSRKQEDQSTLISPDISICSDCLAELFDPRDRRYRYPFINCTNCGPRYTIIDDVPYDRPNTSMKHFAMCENCRVEYEDPGDRRFHAQPNACPGCGPQVRLLAADRSEAEAEDPVKQAAGLLRRGFILALKGLGGFHLAVDAQNHEAVKRLRQRKGREEKPFALMSPDVESITRFAAVAPEERKLLESPQRPIVLLEKKDMHFLSSAVSPENASFGVMLPYTPLHYLLLTDEFSALVMTSANASDEPIVIGNEEAFERLSGIADYFLIHNRGIRIRSDDSIVAVSRGPVRFIRRSRGYVPVPLFLDRNLPPLLACGAELKNTVCLTKADQAFVSQHIGDLQNSRTYDFFTHTISHLERILDIEPEMIACDMHPGYLSTRYALEHKDLPLIQVQHHHAHIASCMAENRISGDVLGLAFDGTGYGTDGRIWGGELFAGNPANFQRLAHLAYAPMPGGDAAVREPWRMGVSYLYQAFGDELMKLDLPLFKFIEPAKIRFVRDMAAKGINSPLTSSMGRLFDGVAAIAGVRNHAGFEGQAAMALEGWAADTTNYLKNPCLYNCRLISGEVCQIVVDDIIRGVARDVQNGAGLAAVSTRFHLSLIQIFAELCSRFRDETGLNRVVLSGGAFQNAILLRGLIQGLGRKGFQVYTQTRVPANDGGISLGQAVVAAARAESL
ncbi:MAG: carbamoyltransferase HypF [Desulfosalsimonadaceae bacterium]